MQQPILLSNRGVLRLTGEDRKNFLQGLITNDIHLLTPFHSLYTALLSPQGKFLHDFFLVEEGETIFLETGKDQLEPLKKRLSLYKLRAQVILEDISDVYAVFVMSVAQGSVPGQTETWQRGVRFIDPRLSLLGARGIMPYKKFPSSFMYQDNDQEYERLRIQLGIPTAGKDMIPERSIPLETGLQDLNAISWTKGCYLGQELTARTRYRGEVRKRLLPVKIASDSFDATQPILDLKGRNAGELYSFQGARGIARLRLEKLKGHLFINSVPLTAHIPAWINL